jgi:YesN/AraC family two-component response regulator
MDDPRIRSAILKALETDKVYLDPELSLQSLSAKLTLSPAVVSAVINSEWKKSFRTLINDYRVEAVKSMMQGPKVNQLSILGIAYECGFNSEASFYRIFKASVGLSPKEYLRTISRENDSQNIF